MTARRIAHPIAEFRAALTPPLTASAPPVKKPAITIDIPCQPSGGTRFSQKHAHTRVVRILLFPNSFDSTVERREQACQGYQHQDEC